MIAAAPAAIAAHIANLVAHATFVAALSCLSARAVSNSRRDFSCCSAYSRCRCISSYRASPASLGFAIPEALVIPLASISSPARSLSRIGLGGSGSATFVVFISLTVRWNNRCYRRLRYRPLLGGGSIRSRACRGMTRRTNEDAEHPARREGWPLLRSGLPRLVMGARVAIASSWRADMAERGDTQKSGSTSPWRTTNI